LGNLSALTAIVDPNGNTTTLTVVSLGPVLRVTQITDPVGRSINLACNSGNLVASATDPLGRMVSYTYNPAGTLATVTDAGGGTTRFYYNSQNQLTSMVDPRGATVFQDFYDSNGRVSRQILANGAFHLPTA
jgi:YD repeat-containing protein